METYGPNGESGDDPPIDPRRFAWTENVATSTAGGGFAYVPNRVVVRAHPDANRFAGFALKDEELIVVAGPNDALQLILGKFDVVRLTAQLRAHGVDAQPDHVFFAHACECCCGPHPSELMGYPVHGNPVHGNPVHGNPVHGNPVHGNPVHGNSQDTELPTTSSARPAKEPDSYNLYQAGLQQFPRVTVIDSGLANSIDQLPNWLEQAFVDSPDGPDVPDANNDQWLDPIAGHGTFIAGIIEQYAPGCGITVLDRLQPQGQGNELDLVVAIEAQANLPEALRPQFLSLSFGGAVWDYAFALESAVLRAQQQGIVVVASAGNDSTCQPAYPAAIAGVVSVGAIGPDGPAWFTNYGSWVRACAPGVDIVSGFFNAFDGRGVPTGGVDPDSFTGWAKWSGTSFSAPTVVAALVREMRISNCTQQQAVERIIESPWLARIPGLGTVVNL